MIFEQVQNENTSLYQSLEDLDLINTIFSHAEHLLTCSCVFYGITEKHYSGLLLLFTLVLWKLQYICKICLIVDFGAGWLDNISISIYIGIDTWSISTDRSIISLNSDWQSNVNTCGYVRLIFAWLGSYFISEPCTEIGSTTTKNRVLYQVFRKC